MSFESYDVGLEHAIENLPLDKRAHILASKVLYSMVLVYEQNPLYALLCAPIGALQKGVEKEFGDKGERVPEDVKIAMKRAFYALSDVAEQLLAAKLDNGDLIADLVGVYAAAVRQGLMELEGE